MPRRVYIYVNGIMTFPGLSRNWNRRAVTWTHLNTPHRAESLEYLVGPFTRPFFQGYRARKLLRKIRYYHAHGWEICLVGHSNGCDVIMDALVLAWRERITVHRVDLIAAACSNDCRRNGVNLVMGHGSKTRRLVIYRSSADRALQLATSLFGQFLGYGALGLYGPKHLTEKGVRLINDDACGHSDWLAEEGRFHLTMSQITNPSIA